MKVELSERLIFDKLKRMKQDLTISEKEISKKHKQSEQKLQQTLTLLKEKIAKYKLIRTQKL